MGKEKSASLLGRSYMEKRSCVFIDKWLWREWRECVGMVPHSIIQTTVSLSGSSSVSKPPLLALAMDISAKPSCPYPPNTESPIPYLLLLSLSLALISIPTFASLSFSFSGMKPLTGRWADGDRQCSPGRKLIGKDWERIWR